MIQEDEREKIKRTIQEQNAALNQIEEEYDKIESRFFLLEDEIEKKEKEICDQFHERSLMSVIKKLTKDYESLVKDIELIESKYEKLEDQIQPKNVSNVNPSIQRLKEMNSVLENIRNESQLQKVEDQINQLEQIKIQSNNLNSSKNENST